MKDEIEFWDIVNENDDVIGKISENDKDYNPKQLRFINIIISTSENKIIVPKRSGNRRIFPNCYDFSVGGHVNSGEDYETAAYRELKEELNIEDVELEEIGYFNPYKSNMNTFFKLYGLKYDKEIIDYDKDGITDIYYFTIEEIEKLLKKEPNHFKDDYVKVIQYIKDRN